MNRTYTAKPSTIERKWYVVDATGIPIGRLAAQVAQILRGKHKPTFTYNQDCGDFVVVINASKVVLTGRKERELIYWHTGWPNGLRNVTRGTMLENTPEKLVEKVIWGMLPKTKLGHQIVKKLKVYANDQHPHEAQQPELLTVVKA
ncbi:MAG: 50S ribosomal protein L13 [Armatimonadetes bacterium]|nr:50S ribosomal protein L13 [Armatimonadota bacterium]